MTWTYTYTYWTTSTSTNPETEPPDTGKDQHGHWQHPIHDDYDLCGKYDPSEPDVDVVVTCPDCLYLDAHDLYFEVDS